MNIRKSSANLYGQEEFEDDQFKLNEEKLVKGVVSKRLKNIFPHDMNLSAAAESSSKGWVNC